MAQGAEAFVDTSALIAFADRSDAWHPLFKELLADPPRLVTTTLVVAEGHSWFLRRYGRAKALQFLALVEAVGPMKLMSTGHREIEAATSLLRRFSDQDLTLVDAVSLHTMSARRIRTCWSTDHHLGVTGVTLAIHTA